MCNEVKKGRGNESTLSCLYCGLTLDQFHDARHSFHSASNADGRMLRWNIGKALSRSLCWKFTSREDTETGKRDLLPETSVVVLSELCTIDPTGKTKKLTCTCSDKIVSTRECRSCKCAKREKPDVAIICGCICLCGHLAGGTVTPLPPPPLSDPNRAPTTYP